MSTTGLQELTSPRGLIYGVDDVEVEPSVDYCKVLGVDIPTQTLNAHQILDMDKVPKESFDSTAMVNMHCHKTRSSEIDKRARRKLIIATVLCTVFMICEIIGGYLSSSLAIASDAAHLLTDLASFLISLLSLWVATWPSTRKMSFGWYRAEMIGALTSVLMIWLVTGILVYLAVERLIHGDYEIDTFVMLITSGLGLGVNLIMGLTLHQHGHNHSHSGESGHSHGHGHGHSHGANRKQENINVRAAYIHVLGDFIQSLGVFIAAIIIYCKPEWSIVDPICTFFFSILVVSTTFSVIKDTLLVLMEGMPKGMEYNEVMSMFLSIDGVQKVHSLRIWALSLDKTAVSGHLAIVPGTNPQTTLMEATKLVYDKYNFMEMTLQIEDFQNEMETCSQCESPDK